MGYCSFPARPSADSADQKILRFCQSLEGGLGKSWPIGIVWRCILSLEPLECYVTMPTCNALRSSSVLGLAQSCGTCKSDDSVVEGELDVSWCRVQGMLRSAFVNVIVSMQHLRTSTVQCLAHTAKTRELPRLWRCSDLGVQFVSFANSLIMVSFE